MAKNIITNCSEDGEFLHATPRKHLQRSTIQHWQLRDLIASPRSRKEFVFVNQHDVLSYNTATQLTSPILKSLNFAPTSLTVGCGYLACGGQRSQLTVRDLNSAWHAQTSVGGSINNALCISQHLGETRLLVSNNDETIKVYNLPGMQRVGNIALPTAVNYTSVSPDGRKMVTVGDSNEVYVFDISAGGYHRVATLTASNDAGFSAAWNASSDKFAVASQDGFVSVWDIRSSEKLAKLNSKQSPQVKGAVRCLKFSPSGPIDLLMFSEHVTYFNVVDARTFNQKQSIRVTPAGQDQHISGLAYSPDSRSVFVGTESHVLEYDVDTVARRSFPDARLI